MFRDLIEKFFDQKNILSTYFLELLHDLSCCCSCLFFSVWQKSDTELFPCKKWVDIRIPNQGEVEPLWEMEIFASSHQSHPNVVLAKNLDIKMERREEKPQNNLTTI